MHLLHQDDQLKFIASSTDGLKQDITGSVSSIRNLLDQGISGATVEEAIAQVEDLIMPILRSLPASTELTVSGQELAKVLSLVSANEGNQVQIDTIERLFNQLADHAAGSPIAWPHTLSADTVAPGLIILRELMHHGGFSSVSVKGP